MELSKEKILLSVIVPCFNEINTIEEVINKIKNSPIDSKEIIIVDDFSTDGSKDFLGKIKDKEIVTIFHEKNKEFLTSLNQLMNKIFIFFFLKVQPSLIS